MYFERDFGYASVAQNPDLIIHCDKNGNPYHERVLVTGENGYRCEAAVIIGESYWYAKSKAQPGDTFGIKISNIMTHARYALFLNNALRDSEISGVRLFGNGFMAAYFGEGIFENIEIRDVRYDMNCHPLPGDEHIVIDWNYTESKGKSCFYFHDSQVKDLVVHDIVCAGQIDRVFSGRGKGNIICNNIGHRSILKDNDVVGIEFN